MKPLRKLLHSFKFAFQGIKFTFQEEQNMKIHVFVALAIIIAGFVFGLSYLEWVAIVLCIGVVFAAEIFNTSIENIVNFISPQQHPLAGRIKDLSAGAVVICAIMSVVVGCIIFIPKILCLL